MKRKRIALVIIFAIYLIVKYTILIFIPISGVVSFLFLLVSMLFLIIIISTTNAIVKKIIIDEPEEDIDLAELGENYAALREGYDDR